MLDPFSALVEADDSPLAGMNLPHFAPKAKRVIYLFQSGGPSQLELFDYKPLLNKMRGQRFTRFCSERTALNRHDFWSSYVPISWK